MIRLYALVEGQTEETFFNEVLAPHLWAHARVQAQAQLLANKAGAATRTHKGGWTSYAKARDHLHREMRRHAGPEVWFTTLFDLYALPDDFPKREEARRIADPHERVRFLEAAFRDDVVTDGHWRFIPHLQLHEFEALLLADPARLADQFFEHAEAITALVQEVAGFASPERVNDGPDTAPSKRIIRRIPAYRGRKASAGPLIARAIGLPTLRARCPHFAQWLSALENLPSRG